MQNSLLELDRLSAQAWADLGCDVQRAGLRVGDCAKSLVEEHPLLAVGGGAALGAVAMSRFMTPEAPKQKAPRRSAAKRAHWLFGATTLFSGVVRELASYGIDLGAVLAGDRAKKPEADEMAAAHRVNGQGELFEGEPGREKYNAESN
jgi:hypothetical protein